MLAVRHAGADHRRELVIWPSASRWGWGALNELAEFLVILAHHGAHAAGTGIRAGISCATSSGPALLGRSSLGPGPARDDAGHGRDPRRRPASGSGARPPAPAARLAVIVIGSLTPGYTSGPMRSTGPPHRASDGPGRTGGFRRLRAPGCGRGQHPAAVRRAPWATLACCVTLYGVACVIAGGAPKDQPGAVQTAVSQVHVAAAVLAGTLAIGAMTLVSRCGLTRSTRRAAAAMVLLNGLPQSS